MSAVQLLKKSRGLFRGQVCGFSATVAQKIRTSAMICGIARDAGIKSRWGFRLQGRQFRGMLTLSSEVELDRRGFGGPAPSDCDTLPEALPSGRTQASLAKDRDASCLLHWSESR